jgi:hypothetical protein
METHTDFLPFIEEIKAAVLATPTKPSENATESETVLGAIQEIGRAVFAAMKDVAVYRDLTVEESDLVLELYSVLIKLHTAEQRLIAARKQFDVLAATSAVN